MTALPELSVERVRVPRLAEAGSPDTAAFSRVISDHMLTAEYGEGGWRDVRIRPYAPLSLPPSITALQYGISVFEGLKAHRLPSGAVALFRPHENARRLNRSARRLAIPDVPEQLFLGGLRALVDVDRDWVPPAGRGALYIRPCLFSIDESIRVKPADRFLLVIFTFPFGDYYGTPVDVLVTERYVRAFPGGTGDVKPAGNYAAALVADAEARDAGCQTVLWLDGRERRYVEECGVMNVFFGVGDEVLTPSLDGTILPGITRESAIRLLRDMGVKVRERRIAIEEVVEAHEAGRLTECFGTGTAATLTHVARIRHRDRDLVLPPVAQRSIGPGVRERLVAIATGQAPDPYGWLDIVRAGTAGGA